MSIYNDISALLQKGRAKEIKVQVQEALEQGNSPKEILDKGLIQGMSEIGERFKRNEAYVPEVLIAARAMNAALEVLNPALIDSGVKPIGKAIICTVKGDLHDIGKNLVKMMIQGQGIECIDLGVDVSEKDIVEAIKVHNPYLVCLSSLLTTTMMEQKNVIDAIKKSNLRDKVKIMVGGAPITEEFAAQIGADAYTPDAASAANVARAFFN